MSLDPRNRLRHPGSKSVEAGYARPSTAIEVTVPEGTSVMRAAMDGRHPDSEALRHRHGRFVRLLPVCLVEIEGRNGTPASCTTPVAEGMKVKTQTDRLQAMRKGVMELYISDHPLTA